MDNGIHASCYRYIVKKRFMSGQTSEIISVGSNYIGGVILQKVVSVTASVTTCIGIHIFCSKYTGWRVTLCKHSINQIISFDISFN